MNCGSAILQALGGEDNIVDVSHCATRLRFQLRDSSLVDQCALIALPDVLGALSQADNGYQVIIGGKVHDVFAETTAALQLSRQQKTQQSSTCPHENHYANTTPHDSQVSPSLHMQQGHVTRRSNNTPTFSGTPSSVATFPFPKPEPAHQDHICRENTPQAEEKTTALPSQHPHASPHENDDSPVVHHCEKIRNNPRIQNKENRPKTTRQRKSFYFLLRFFGDALGPLIGPLLGASLIITFISLLTMTGGIEKWSTAPDTSWGGTQSSLQADPSWTFINLMWTSVFTFLPLMVAYNASRKMAADPWVGFTIMGFVLLPGFARLADYPQAYAGYFFNMPVTFIRIFGLPLPLFNYLGQVIVPLLIALILGPLYRFLNRVIPATISLMCVPFAALTIMLPLTAFLIGPIGAYIGATLAHGLSTINTSAPVLFALLVPLLFPIVVPLGLHWPINALILLNISEKGYDYIQGPMGAWNFACFGATTGVLLLAIREKDAPLRQVASRAIAVGLTSGISEPSIYGIHSRFRRSYISIVAGCVIGGLIMGWGGGVTTRAFAFTSVLTIPIFQPVGLYVAAITAAFIISLFSVLIFGYRSPKNKPDEGANQKIRDTHSNKSAD